MEYKLLTDVKEIEQLTYEYVVIMSNDRLQEAMKKFSEKRGYSQEYNGFHFKHELDEYDDPDDKLDDSHILFSIDKPAAREDCEAYLTFEEFYNYLEAAINRVLKDGHEVYDEPKIRELLKEVKKGLELS